MGYTSWRSALYLKSLIKKMSFLQRILSNVSTWTWVNTQGNCRWDALSHIPISYYLFFFPEQWHLLVLVSSSYGRWNRLWKALNRIEWRSETLLTFSSRTWELFQKSLLVNNYECRNSLYEVQIKEATNKYCLFHIHNKLFTTKMVMDRVEER